MYDANDPTWIEASFKRRSEAAKKKRLEARNPALVLVDGKDFMDPLGKLAKTVALVVEREGLQKLPGLTVPSDVAMILRQLIATYSLLMNTNADEKRDGDPGYRLSHSFVILPLVRTMIDGLYNCTAMLDDTSRGRVFRISGYYRMREAIRIDEDRYGQDPDWHEALTYKRAHYEAGLRDDGFTDADLDDKKNEWPLLGKYLGQRPDTPHRRMLRKFTLGFWKEYSSISHASFDGMVGIYGFIAPDLLGPDRRGSLREFGERSISMHVGRSAAILLCLLTEIQNYFKFDNAAEIDERLTKIWSAMIDIYEVKELYDSRYRDLLRISLPSRVP
jgi:hypothetical protein